MNDTLVRINWCAFDIVPAIVLVSVSAANMSHNNVTASIDNSVDIMASDIMNISIYLYTTMYFRVLHSCRLYFIGQSSRLVYC